VFAANTRCDTQVWIPNTLIKERVAVNFKIAATMTSATPNNPTNREAQAHLQHFIE